MVHIWGQRGFFPCTIFFADQIPTLKLFLLGAWANYTLHPQGVSPLNSKIFRWAFQFPGFPLRPFSKSRASFSIRAADYQDVDDGSGSLGEYALALALGGMAIVWHDCASGQTARPYAAPGLRSATRRHRAPSQCYYSDHQASRPLVP